MRKTSPIAPANGYLVLEILDDESPKGFDVEDSDQIPQRGKVLAVGGDTFYEGEVFKSPAKVGDIILHSGFGYEDVIVQGEKFRLCPFIKTVGVIK